MLCGLSHEQLDIRKRIAHLRFCVFNWKTDVISFSEKLKKKSRSNIFSWKLNPSPKGLLELHQVLNISINWPYSGMDNYVIMSLLLISKANGSELPYIQGYIYYNKCIIMMTSQKERRMRNQHKWVKSLKLFIQGVLLLHYRWVISQNLNFNVQNRWIVQVRWNPFSLAH